MYQDFLLPLHRLYLLKLSTNQTMRKYFFAVDLGATSGRTIVGSLNDGKIELEELTRFPNNLIEVNGHFSFGQDHIL